MFVGRSRLAEASRLNSVHLTTSVGSAIPFSILLVWLNAPFTITEAILQFC